MDNIDKICVCGVFFLLGFSSFLPNGIVIGMCVAMVGLVSWKWYKGE